MGLFDFFKKQFQDNKQAGTHQAHQPVSNNSYLLQTLKIKLVELGYPVATHQSYLALIVNTELEIATVIVDHPNSHPNLLHLMILTTHPKYFPNGIIENIAGFGNTLQDKVASAIDNYVSTTFLTIMDSFSDSHNPEIDLWTTFEGKDILWHPKLGNLTSQGKWNSQPDNDPFFEILKDKIKGKLTTQKLNWLKLYISRQVDGSIIGECNFNNEPWEEGLIEITKYAASWKMIAEFQGLKQFIMFRRCDAHDT